MRNWSSRLWRPGGDFFAVRGMLRCS
jgi:hypothetical protein